MATIFMRFPGGKAKALTLSYDDGVEQDIRLIEIMKANGLKGTFNINTGCYAAEGTVYPEGQIHRRMSKSLAKKTYLDSGMEVAVHTLTHPYLEWEAENVCAYDIPTDWLRLPTTCHHINPRLMELAEKFVEGKVERNPWLFYLWGHSYEFEQKDNWHVIEEFAKYTGNREDIWYATNIEIYDYVSAYKQLIFSVDGKTVHNPTATTLYFEHRNKIYCIKPGETITENIW